MNESFLAFTGKLNQERFSPNLTLNWSSAIYLKMTIEKGLIWHVPGLSRLYLLCDNDDIQYFCHVREDATWTLFEFYKSKNAPV